MPEGNETLLALDLKRGKPLWTGSRELRVFSEPALHDSRLYVNLPDTSILALDPRTGREAGRTTPAFGAVGPLLRGADCELGAAAAGGHGALRGKRSGGLGGSAPCPGCIRLLA
ncbi:PQQ-binding-like beta-propeller repeat protein [Streptomyces sp. NBC_01530]|uniref:PQQ-binding-like beta-propeller repeat protein n=1 Tax=Streptomyces sp. NBC_01530 TaxID=2903895 RepID=UPI003865EA5B